MTDLAGLLDLADLATSRCDGALAPQARRDFARVALRARRRVGYVGEILAVAFAGGTGSGKSSLINAIVGVAVVRTGVVRPTTDAALAVVPHETEDRYDRLLSELGVKDRIESRALTELILVDLPDLDSIEAAHKHIVESVLPVVDAVVWVFDPEKYADETIHTEFLAKLVPYEEQFVFVLNQVDRLSESTGIVAKDLGRLLGADGFSEPVVVSTSAIDGDTGASELIEVLSDRLDTKRTVMSKIVIDLRVAANEGWLAACEAGSTRTDQIQLDETGLAAASFVSLGVQASEVLRRLKEG
jgi:GTP-binding protein EngB required for normal cell division